LKSAIKLNIHQKAEDHKPETIIIKPLNFILGQIHNYIFFIYIVLIPKFVSNLIPVKMKRLTLLTLIFFFFHMGLFAQKENENLKEMFLDAEYFLLNEDYGEALSNYLAIYKRGYSENGNINFRIGQCYLNISGEKSKAIPYLEKAVLTCSPKYQEGVFKETNAPYDAYFYLGNAYRINNDLEKAVKNYEMFKSFYTDKDEERIAFANQQIEACATAAYLMKNPVNIFTHTLDKPVSTGSSDIYPVVSGDLNVLVYVSRQKFYDAIYYCHKVNNKWSAPINITPEIQSDGDQYPTFLSYDGTELYLRKEDNFEADLLVSKKNNGVWTKSISVGKNINSKYWEGNLSITKDGTTMFFSSNRKDGSGAVDIFKSTRQSNGEWGIPVSLGSKINTVYNEDAPYITEDGTRLYFISQGHKTMGGYDIFYCNLLPDGQISDPENIGYPINTTDDDLYFYPVKNGQMAYTALTQKGNLGFEDLFEIYIKPTPELIASINNPDSRQPSERIDSETTVQSIIKPDSTKNEALKEESSPIILPTLFFEFNSWELTENNMKSLDYILTVLKNYDDIKIQFTGHTDAMGADKYNQVLSERRALAAKNYLIKKGITTNAITVKGFGEKQFIALNKNTDGTDNPDGRKFNRRVEVKVIESKEDRKIIIMDLNIPESLKIEQP